MGGDSYYPNYSTYWEYLVAAIKASSDINLVLFDCQGITSTIFTGWTQLVSFSAGNFTIHRTGALFSSCTNMVSMYLPLYITDTGANTFLSLEKLTDIAIASYSYEAGGISNMFNGCSSLEYLNLEGLQYFNGANTFTNCTSLEKIYLTNDTFYFPNNSCFPAGNTEDITLVLSSAAAGNTVKIDDDGVTAYSTGETYSIKFKEIIIQ
ncbi:MAG: leucine-rich repeat protein [Rikenellaceae bacterium]